MQEQLKTHLRTTLQSNKGQRNKNMILQGLLQTRRDKYL